MLCMGFPFILSHVVYYSPIIPYLGFTSLLGILGLPHGKSQSGLSNVSGWKRGQLDKIRMRNFANLYEWDIVPTPKLGVGLFTHRVVWAANFGNCLYLHLKLLQEHVAVVALIHKSCEGIDEL